MYLTLTYLSSIWSIISINNSLSTVNILSWHKQVSILSVELFSFSGIKFSFWEISEDEEVFFFKIIVFVRIRKNIYLMSSII